jgi:hypothetical protein
MKARKLIFGALTTCAAKAASAEGSFASSLAKASRKLFVAAAQGFKNAQSLGLATQH